MPLNNSICFADAVLMNNVKAGKVAVFGILKRQGKVFTLVVENNKQDTLLPVMKRKIMSDSIVYTDCHKRYDVLDVGEFTHHRINHS